MGLNPRVSFFQAEYTIVMPYVHHQDPAHRRYLWRVDNTSGECVGSGFSDDETEAFQCAALHRGQLAEADAERERVEKERYA